ASSAWCARTAGDSSCAPARAAASSRASAFRSKGKRPRDRAPDERGFSGTLRGIPKGHPAMKRLLAVLAFAFAPAAFAQTCPEKNLLYWQAFPAGGESDISARHQQLVLKKKCPAIETIIQYKPGAGGGLLWMQLNQLPGDGLNIAGINLPHIVLQPMEGTVQ